MNLTIFTGGLGGPAAGLLTQGYQSTTTYVETGAGGVSFGGYETIVADTTILPEGGIDQSGVAWAIARSPSDPRYWIFASPIFPASDVVHGPLEIE